MRDGLLGQRPIAIVKEVIECMLAIPRWILPGPIRLEHLTFFPVKAVEQTPPQLGDGRSKKDQQPHRAARSYYRDHCSRHGVANQNRWLIQIGECGHNRSGIFVRTGVGIAQRQIHGDDAVATRA